MLNGARQSMHPSDVRLANALKIIGALRGSKGLSHSDVARTIGLSVPAVHRLMSELVDKSLVEEQVSAMETASVGRPATIYKFREDAAFLAGVDIGNGTTRIVLTDLDFIERASLSFRTDELGPQLPTVLARSILRLRDQQEGGEIPLIGVGIGVPASVDPGTGVLQNLPVLSEYEGLRLAYEMEQELSCPVAVQQDDHYSALAESSRFGSWPGAGSLLVLEIGWGIGVGVCFDGQPVPGYRGSFGRIAGWPVSVLNDCLPGATLGEVLTTAGLLQQYQKRGGHFPIHDGLGLVEAARGGEKEALLVLEWAGNEIAQTILRLSLLCDPEAVVFGGGLSRAFDLFEATFSAVLPQGFNLVPSVLKDRAVVMGAALEANRFVQEWFRSQLFRA
jgi:predicted NBD/HSP70 family sugar kinase